MLNTDTNTITINTDTGPEIDEAMAQARRNAGSVRYFDTHSDPSNPGWVLRTYTTDGDHTDEAE